MAVDPSGLVKSFQLDDELLKELSAELGEQAQRKQFVDTMLGPATEAGKRLGVGPRGIIAQAALESAWGKRQAGPNNIFSIKATGDWQGPSVLTPTTEFYDGKPVSISDSFRSYDSSAASLDDYVKLLMSNPRYAAALNAGDDVRKFAQGLQTGGYATDPEYANKIVSISDQLPLQQRNPDEVIGRFQLGPVGPALADPGPRGRKLPLPYADPGPGGMLGGLMQAEGVTVPADRIGPIDSFIRAASEDPVAASGADTWQAAKGALAGMVSGLDLQYIDSKIKNFELTYNRSPWDYISTTKAGMPPPPNTPQNVEAARRDPQYQEMVNEAADKLRTAKEISGDMGELFARNPNFWSQVQLKLAQMGATLPPTIAVGMTTRSPTLAGAMMFGTSEPAAYSGLRAADVPAEEASKHAGIEGAIGAAANFIPMGQALKFGTPLYQRIVASIKAAVPTASAATIASEINHYVATLPRDMTVDDWQQAVANGLVKLPETWALAAAQGGLMGAFGHLNQKSDYRPGTSYTEEFGDFLRQGAGSPGAKPAPESAWQRSSREWNEQMAAHEAAKAAAPRAALPAKIAEPAETGSPAPEPAGVKASAPIPPAAQGTASTTPTTRAPASPTKVEPPVQQQAAQQPLTTQPVPPQTPPSPAASAAGPPSAAPVTAAPPVAPASTVPESAPAPHAAPVSTTVQGKKTGGAAPTKEEQIESLKSLIESSYRHLETFQQMRGAKRLGKNQKARIDEGIAGNQKLIEEWSQKYRALTGKDYARPGAKPPVEVDEPTLGLTTNPDPAKMASPWIDKAISGELTPKDFRGVLDEAQTRVGTKKVHEHEQEDSAPIHADDARRALEKVQNIYDQYQKVAALVPQEKQNKPFQNAVRESLQQLAVATSPTELKWAAEGLVQNLAGATRKLFDDAPPEAQKQLTKEVKAAKAAAKAATPEGQIRALKKAEPEFGRMLKDIHPESEVAASLHRGWQDAKNGTEISEAQVKRMLPTPEMGPGRYNPIQPYLMGYTAALGMKPPDRIPASEVPKWLAKVAEHLENREIAQAKPAPVEDEMTDLDEDIGTSAAPKPDDDDLPEGPGPQGKEPAKPAKAKRSKKVAKAADDGAQEVSEEQFAAFEKQQSRPEPTDEKPNVVAAPSEDALPAIAARKAAEAQARLDAKAAKTPASAPKRDTHLGRSTHDTIWYDLAPQQPGESWVTQEKQIEAFVERMRNAPVPIQTRIVKSRTQRIFGFKSISIDPSLSSREALDVLLDAYNNLSTHSALTGLPATAMGFNGGLNLKLQKRIGGAGTRGMFSMKFGRPFEESATIQLARRADSFVHEWMHGLDFNMLMRFFLDRTGGLSEKTALGTTTLPQNKSNIEEGRVDPLPDSIRNAFLDVMRSIYLTDDASIQRIGQHAVNLEKQKVALSSAVAKLARLKATQNKEAEREARAAKFEAEAATTTDKFRAAGMRRNAAAIREKNARLESDIKAAQAAVERAQAAVDKTMKEMTDLLRAKASHLFQASTYVDQLSGAPYFSLPTELLARAGESWIGNKVGQQSGVEFLAGSPSYYNENSSRIMQLVYPNPLDRTRINQALENFFSVLGREEYFGDEKPHAAKIPGVTRIDKELFEQNKSNPRVGAIEKAMNAATEDVNQIAKVFAAMTDPREVFDAVVGAGSHLATTWDAVAEMTKIYYTGRGRLLGLISKHKNNPPLAAAIRRVASLVTTDPGSGHVQGVTLEREVAARSQMLINRVARIAEVHNLDMENSITMDLLNEELVRPTQKVRDELTESLKAVRDQIATMEGDRNKETLVARAKQQATQIEQFLEAYKKPSAAPPHIVKAADAFRKIYDEQFYEADGVGIKLGYVSNYQQRTLNRDAVEANSKEFVEQAQKVYEFEALRQLRRLQIEIDKVQDEIRKWRAVERRRGIELPRTKVLEKKAAELRGEASKYATLTEDDTKLMAEEWLYAARTGEMFRFNAATPPSRFIAERKFGPIADILMKDFYEKNPVESMYGYAVNSTRRIAYARRFGDNHEKRSVMLDQLRALKMPEGDIDVLNRVINTVAGYHSAEVTHSERVALDVIYNTASMALLPLNLFNQLSEPLTAGLRTGRVRDSFLNMGYAMQAVFGTGNMEQIRAVGDAIGIISRSGHDQIAMSRLDGADLSKQSRQWMAQYQKRTGVHGFTNASRLGSMKLGGMYIKSVADLYLRAKPEERPAAVSMMNDLGIAPADHQRFAEYASKQGELISLDELDRADNYDLKMQYVHAMHGFVDGVIGNPKPSDKSLWASHPYGRFLTALQAFNYYFLRHHMIRHGKQIGREAAKLLPAMNPKSSQKLLGNETKQAAKDTSAAASRFLMPMLGLMTGALAIRLLRDYFTNRKKYEERMQRIKDAEIARTVADAADLVGAPGPTSQVYNYFFPNRVEDKGLMEMLGGSHAGFYFGAVDDIKEGFRDTRDPNDTSNAAERQAARAFYKITVNTLTPALMSAMGLNGPVGFLAQTSVMNRSMQNAAATAVFPETVSERYNAMKKEQAKAEAASLSPQERAALDDDRAYDREVDEERMIEELEDYESGVTP